MTEKISGAEALMRSLEHEGVDILFGYPGGAIMPTYDALYDHKKTLHHILVRHEQAAVHAAQGYARVSGKVGCAIVTSGPGAMNTITGVADAMIDSPGLWHVPSSSRRAEGLAPWYSTSQRMHRRP